MEPKELAESKETSTTLFTGKIVRLEYDEVRLPNGKMATREVIRHRGAVAVVALTDEGEILLERQYRYPHAEVLWEIPAGKLEAGEDPAEAVKRELQEETGAVAKEWRSLGMFYPSPAILDEKIRLYLARGLTFGKRHLDEDEFLAVERVPLARAVEMILCGEIPDGKTQAAVLRVWAMQKK